MFSDSHLVLRICCATEAQLQMRSSGDGTSVALKYVAPVAHAALVDMDPLVEPEHLGCHLVNKEYLPRKSFIFRADRGDRQSFPIRRSNS